MKAVILCGGSGSRLWPLSTSDTPKQFLSLVHLKHTMFQQTCLLAQHAGATELLLVANQQYKEIIVDQMASIPLKIPSRVLLEPISRNTAAAITAAALCSGHPETVLLVMPSDHVWDFDTFSQSSREAVILAEDNDSIVTLGITPTYPETGYGYIRYRGTRVIEFTEKPNLATAEYFLESGDYLWNSGVFVAKSLTLSSEVARYRPTIYERVAQSLPRTIFADTIELDAETFSSVDNISFDYAVMEKTWHAMVVQYKGFWSDVGSFKSLKDILSPKDSSGNHFRGRVRSMKCSDSLCIVPQDANIRVNLLGVHNIIVVVAADGKDILITTEEECQAVKELVKL